MPIEHPSLPYADTALAPHVSQETLQFHHGKHHKTYVDNANKLIVGTPLADATVEAIVRQAHASGNKPLFNNAAQAWNHAFYWKSMSPNGGGRPKGLLLDKIGEAFGSFEAFREELAKAAVTQFGSGWAWLVLEGGKVKVAQTPNAETPLVTTERTPLLTIDVWEHAYYVDYRNRRPDYVSTFIDKLLNWEFAAANLAAAKA
jgi:Fe-Mn family superoxide dismutase